MSGSWQFIGLAAGGLLAGAVNAVAGGGSMISFPALLAMGVAPVTANVTSAVAAVPGYLGGSIGYAAELTGQGRRIVRLGLVSVVGAAGGALTLLVVSADVFRAVVPGLVLASAVMLAVQPRVLSWVARRGGGGSHRPALLSSQLAVAFYGGFFAAGLGIVMLATLGMFLNDSTQRLNALKGVLSLVVGSVSAIAFVSLTSVAWGPAVLLAATGLVGGRLGVLAARRIPPAALRWTVAVWGGGVAIALEVSRHVS
ncbi:sulfite exporter TauE/SafE family protein [Micromonospora inyonensis]|uniref:Probable membrane transporter protein n=1 Tax=Micromonospora inyonensis TaxID=47866 RepID=A0A1C6S7V9_9ACTN|nr:sulfite exporter TauE/SafE family protein [Micromonospora inyonensis]SCL25584.1 hypothetical protein GA0074694_4263 [Micromonospora inyonensis]